MIGNEPFEEEILETTLDARSRLLAPGARLIPHALTLLARPVLLPDAEMRQRAFGRAAVARWRDLYDIDFTPLLDAAIPGPTHTVTEGEIVATWPQVGPPVALTTIDLTTFTQPSVRALRRSRRRASGCGQRGCVTFRAGLHDGLAHTMDPWTWPASSWATSVWVLPDPLEVGTGCVLRVDYHRRVPGRADGLTCEVVDRLIDGSSHVDDAAPSVRASPVRVQRGHRWCPSPRRQEPPMGMVRRRTRRRTMMVAGGLAYARGRNQGAGRRGRRRAGVRAAAGARTAAPGAGCRRRDQRARAPGVIAPVGCALRR